MYNLSGNMKLREYNDLKCKLGKYQQVVIKTAAEFDKWYTNFDRTHLIFRGSTEAKRKNYTSSQREWITKEWGKVLNISYIDYIDKLLSQIRSDKLLIDYFVSLGIAPNDILYLSFMQHYAMPTPLIDFTKDLPTALFFATDGLTHEASSVEIENYCSVYALLPTDQIAPADRVFANAYETGVRIVEEYRQKNPDVEVNDDLVKYIDDMTKWIKKDGTRDGLHSFSLTYIPNPSDAVPVISASGQRLYWSNPNIVAQQGCFVMNPSETEVLEDVIASNPYIPNMICIDIHKSLADYIKKKYVSNMNQDTIYPKFKKVADKAYEEFKKNL